MILILAFGFFEEQLADFNNYSLSKDNNISVITPEYTTFGQILVRDNKQRMIIFTK